MRADARRNRARIVSAAIEFFGLRGTGVRLDEVAAAAGIGVATLYRRFPTREDLLEEIVVETVGRMVARIESEPRRRACAARIHARQ